MDYVHRRRNLGGGGGGGGGGAKASPILGIMCIKYAEFILDTPFGPPPPPPPNPVYVPTLLTWTQFTVSLDAVNPVILLAFTVPVWLHSDPAFCQCLANGFKCSACYFQVVSFMTDMHMPRLCAEQYV